LSPFRWRPPDLPPFLIFFKALAGTCAFPSWFPLPFFSPLTLSFFFLFGGQIGHRCLSWGTIRPLRSVVTRYWSFRLRSVLSWPSFLPHLCSSKRHISLRNFHPLWWSLFFSLELMERRCFGIFLLFSFSNQVPHFDFFFSLRTSVVC